MNSTKSDELEDLVQQLIIRAKNKGIEPQIFREVLDRAFTQYTLQYSSTPSKLSNNTDNASLYRSLNLSSRFIDSFQVRQERDGKENRGARYYDYDSTRNKVNALFGTRLSSAERGNSKAYFVLERNGEQSKLWSYGSTHKDFVGRDNMHYFEVVGGYDALQKVFQSFRVDSSSISAFVGIIFNWDNTNITERGGKPDLFSNLQQSYFYEAK